jgi:hypothetical protein
MAARSLEKIGSHAPVMPENGCTNKNFMRSTLIVSLIPVRRFAIVPTSLLTGSGSRGIALGAQDLVMPPAPLAHSDVRDPAEAGQASRTLSEISERLYETPGELAISTNEQGLRFVPRIPSSQSAGVMSMQIFCFDFTMAALCRSRGMGPGFLIHDSHLYEPVDGRQFARALRIGAEYAEEIGIQYVVTLNSDELARAETEGNEDFRSFVLAPVLSDAPEAGLFGIRFD